MSHAHRKRNPARGGAAGLENVDCLAAIDGPKISSPKSETQKAAACLLREFCAVALPESAARLSQAAVEILLGNDESAETQISAGKPCFREGAQAFRSMRGALDAMAGRILAQAMR